MTEHAEPTRAVVVHFVGGDQEVWQVGRLVHADGDSEYRLTAKGLAHMVTELLQHGYLTTRPGEPGHYDATVPAGAER